MTVRIDEPHLTDHEWETVEKARQFSIDVIEPQAEVWEKSRRFPREAFAQAASSGLTGLIVAKEGGGSGLSVVAMARVMETLAAADFAFAFALVVHNNLAANIARNGSPAQKTKYLPVMLSGERIGAFLLTEPSGGSDAAAIKSLAIKADNGWTLSGHKSWISNAAAADILSVYANTDPSKGWRGIACFLIDADLAGVKRGQTYDLMGGHALGTGEFAFDKVALSTEDLFLPTERAFKEAMAGIDLARVNVAAMACGMLSSALAQAISYAQTREVFGQTVAELQGPQWQLADVATDLAAARALTYQAANALKADADATILSAHAKKFATRMALERISDCMQVMGAAGFRTDRSLGRHLACAKMAQYLDGTTEIQNVVISRGFARRNEP